ncbi:hypothetical protein D3C78_1596480 [compost metagenome]
MLPIVTIKSTLCSVAISDWMLNCSLRMSSAWKPVMPRPVTLIVSLVTSRSKSPSAVQRSRPKT